jgi:hypothetical protein
MQNWSIDEKKFKKQSPKEYRLWRLTQLINYGLNGKKLVEKEVRRAWPKIKDRIDPNTKVYLEYLLWKKHPSSKNIKKGFWNL